MPVSPTLVLVTSNDCSIHALCRCPYFLVSFMSFTAGSARLIKIHDRTPTKSASFASRSYTGMILILFRCHRVVIRRCLRRSRRNIRFFGAIFVGRFGRLIGPLSQRRTWTRDVQICRNCRPLGRYCRTT